MAGKTRVWPVGLFLVAVALGAAGPSAPPAGETADFVEMEARTVLMDPHIDSPVVLLANDKEGLVLPIVIGVNEALAISLQLGHAELPRPMTHDLLRNVILGLDATVSQVRVTDIKNGTYFAKIVLVSHGTLVEIDSRPSDAIALALRVQAPILVHRSVLEHASPDEPPSPSPPSGILAGYGLALQAMTPALADVFGLPRSETGEGVLISDVIPGSPAAGDGLLRGDVILEVEGTAAQTPGQVERILGAALGESRRPMFKVLRAGRPMRLGPGQ